ncbi:hypothetical protein SELMODRAFT_418844 [Selaginella moellendorffii]|uniref:Uncharacterized protein n=1 Tax=Selaginella moellendorffii TaxID=88036 RepID=D8S6K0_SELML|nr:hypothetical protein SELMODRAFT_418844 [Selaginella moellendorffii]
MVHQNVEFLLRAIRFEPKVTLGQSHGFTSSLLCSMRHLSVRDTGHLHLLDTIALRITCEWRHLSAQTCLRALAYMESEKHQRLDKPHGRAFDAKTVGQNA